MLGELELHGHRHAPANQSRGTQRSLPFSQAQALADEPVRMEEAGHIAATLTESMLEKAFEMGERFVRATQAGGRRGIIGPFALQCIIVAGPPKEFIVYDVSLRIPGSPGTRFTPYSSYRWGRDVSVGERIAMEVVLARGGPAGRGPDLARQGPAATERVPGCPPSTSRPATVVILDFGAQDSQLIARRAREAGVYSEIVPYDAPWARSRKRDPAAIILTRRSGEHARRPARPDCDPADLARAACRSSASATACSCWRAISAAKLVPLDHASTARRTLTSTRRESPLLLGVPARVARLDVARRLGRRAPPGFARSRTRARCDVAAMGDEARRIYGVQFHPEVVHTEAGTAILENFLHRIARHRRRLEDGVVRRPRDRRDSRARSASDQVICALSGGVDSAVAATLVSRAIGKQLTCIFVDHGLAAQGRSARRAGGVSRRAASQRRSRSTRAERFLARLAGVEDPEEKRIRIGHEFIAVFEEEAEEDSGRASISCKGTLYPDVIESKTPGSQSRAQDQIAPQRRRLARARWISR